MLAHQLSTRILVLLCVLCYTSLSFGQLSKADEKFMEGNLATTFKYYSKKVKKNEPSDLAKLGFMYDYGLAVQEDKRLAHEYYLKALSNGNSPIALAQLAVDYRAGENVEKDRKKRDSLLAAVARNKSILELTPQGSLSLGMLYSSDDLSARAKTNIRGLSKKGIWVGDYLEASLLWNADDPDYEQVFSIYAELANQGHRGAQGNAGYMLTQIFEKDYNKAEKYFQNALNQEFTPTYYQYGRLLYYGDKLPKNTKRALELFRKGVELQNHSCAYMLGFLFENGYTLERNLDSAIFYYKKSYEYYSTDAAGRLGGLYLSKKQEVYDVKKGVAWLQKGVELLDPYSHYRLGVHHVFDDDNEATIQKGITELEWALKSGNKDAAYALGRYFNDTDVNKARDYYLMNAEVGEARSAYYLAMTYNTESELAERMHWMKQSAAKNYTLATIEMGHIYSTDYTLGDEKKLVNYDSAWYWFNKAAENGSTTGHKYANGLLYKDNKNFSNFAYWKVRSDTSAKAKYITGLFYQFYRDGEYIYGHKNYELAIDYYEQAREMSYPKAYNKLGEIYSDGLFGAKKDVEKGREYFEKAIELGFYEAVEGLADSYYRREFEQREAKMKEMYDIYDLKDALHEIGYQYAKFDVEQRDLAKGLKLMLRAAKEGSDVSKKYLNYRDNYSYYDTLTNLETTHAKEVIDLATRAKRGSLRANRDLAYAYLDKKHFFHSENEGEAMLEGLAKEGDFESALYMLNKVYNLVNLDAKDFITQDGTINLDEAPRTRDTTRIIQLGELAIKNLKGNESRKDLFNVYSLMAYTEFNKGVNKNPKAFAANTGLYWDKTFEYSDTIKTSLLEPAAFTHYLLDNYDKLIWYHGLMQDHNIKLNEGDWLRYMISQFQVGEVEGGCATGRYLYDEYEAFYSQYKKECMEVENKSFRVYSKGRFRDSGILIRKGDIVKFTASGRIRLGAWAGSGGPDGIGGYRSYNIVSNVRHGALVGNIGSSKESIFLIGEERIIKASKTGSLHFLVNDTDPGNNSGSFDVKIEITKEKKF
ncbi:MAG: hypothetical protein AAGA64_14805 [Bacteroidota bacterium]